MTITSRPNDVDFNAVVDLVKAIQANPDKAQTKWSAEVDWKGGFRTEAKSRDFAVVGYDEPPALGGSNTAANPVEQILGALGSCLAIGYTANACAQGIELKSLKIRLEGDLDLQCFLGLNDGNAGFSAIRAEVHIDSDADAETIEALHRKVVSTSPVGHTITRPIPIAVDLV